MTTTSAKTGDHHRHSLMADATTIVRHMLRGENPPRAEGDQTATSFFTWLTPHVKSRLDVHHASFLEEATVLQKANETRKDAEDMADQLPTDEADRDTKKKDYRKAANEMVISALKTNGFILLAGIAAVPDLVVSSVAMLAHVDASNPVTGTLVGYGIGIAAFIVGLYLVEIVIAPEGS